ncbi:MMPL family transporter [Pseudorhodoplanes sp.]|uniref:hopanoid transporter HpnN n=1 Tax=Pseudorhodoplanes sp. TaxID=1934341 RepID=UPI002B9B8D56|nr:MMPL family transporter [Pseudorhodoplanes sp.]HWV43079.1 MMPL family transporter [Pseudorhodoplanes sp.]
MARVVGGVVGICTRSPWITIVVFALLTVAASVYTARNFAINTDISNLIAPNIDWRQREIAVEKAFPARVHTILAVVDAPTPELAALAAGTLTDRLKADPKLFPQVQRPDGGPFFETNGLLFLPTEELGRTLGQLEAASPFISILAHNPNWRGLSQAAQAALGGVMAKHFELDSLAPIFDRFSKTFEDALAERPASFSWQEMLSGTKATPSELRRFVDIVPKLDYSALEPGKEATDAVRRAVADENLAQNYQARVRLTGSVPIADEEFATVKEGMLLHGIGTVIVVLFILWLALKSARIILAVFIALAGGLAITAALGFMTVGSLNMISVAFFVLFVGLGVDFCIQYSVRYRDERHQRDELKPALINAGRNIGGPLALAAAATAAGFLAFLPTNYQGVSELGIIAGMGMIIAFLISLTALPALLAVFDPPGEQEPLGYKSLAPADGFVERNRKWVVVGTLGVAILGLPLLYFLRFDFNPINLRSDKVESISTYLDLRRDPNTGASAVNLLTPSLKDAQAAAQRLEKLPDVSRVMSIESFVPADQDAKLALIKQAAAALKPALDAKAQPAPNDDEVRELLTRTAGMLAAAGQQPGAGGAAAKRLADRLNDLAKASNEKRRAAENAVIVPLNFKLNELRKSLQAGPVSLETLPAELKNQWVSADGRYRVEAFPKGDPNDNEVLRSFARKVLEVEPNAIGGPISILKSGDVIVVAFIQAGLLALITISLLLWIALRRIRDVALTVVPLLLAGVITMELCVLLDLPLNFANIIALPLLLGIGVAFKIYYIMAWRAGQTNLLQSSLTRAVIFSALTTATAFGSLWLSSHPGTSSLGKLLALSLVTTMCAAVLFQPALMGRPRNAADSGTDT